MNKEKRRKEHNVKDFKSIFLRRCFDLTCIGGIIWLLANGFNMFSIGFSSMLVFIYIIIGSEIEEDLK